MYFFLITSHSSLFFFWSIFLFSTWLKQEYILRCNPHLWQGNVSVGLRNTTNNGLRLSYPSLFFCFSSWFSPLIVHFLYNCLLQKLSVFLVRNLSWWFRTSHSKSGILSHVPPSVFNTLFLCSKAIWTLWVCSYCDSVFVPCRPLDLTCLSFPYLIYTRPTFVTDEVSRFSLSLSLYTHTHIFTK